MIFNFILICEVLLAVVSGFSREDGYGNFTTYEQGNMNMIITSPHGGYLSPSTQLNGDPWPDRRNGCKNAQGVCVWNHSCRPTSRSCRVATKNDKNTWTVAKEIANEIKRLVGVRPHVVYNNLRRKKLDANRNVSEAAFGIRDAVTAYHDYNNFILKAGDAISGPGLLLDIHGQSHKTHGGPWIELGYAISRKRLNSGQFWKTLSTIRNLGKNVCGSESKSNNPCFKDLIRGNKSLGHFLNMEDLRAVPSPDDPSPGNELYFSGGFTVKRYGSKYGGNIDAIQLEFPFGMRIRWSRYKRAVVTAILCYYKKNYDKCLTLPSSVKCCK